MFLTRSIRRKMVLGLALVMLMLATLCFSGILGVVSYRSVVNDLDFQINRAPSHADLVSDIAMLSESLWRTIPEDRFEVAVAYQQREFLAQLKLAENRIGDFQRKLTDKPPEHGSLAHQQAPITNALLSRLAAGLLALKTHQQGLASRDSHEATVKEMLRRVNDLQKIAQNVPDPQQGLNSTLKHARQVYRSIFLVLVLTSTLVGTLLLGLVHFGYKWIFAPIRKLYVGATRVAQGDFDFRVHLTTNDEMSELAESFNQMTARFQEITGDLDWQVRERSRQLVRSERLAGVGFLAAGVAHEINNPLAAISMATESLLERMEQFLNHADDAEEMQVFPQYLGMIQRESLRCQQITARLLDFSRGQDATRGRNDLTAIVSEVLTLVGHMSKYRDRKITFTRSTPCYLEINGPEIKQVVLNLVANALDSIDPGGSLQIGVSEQTDQVTVTFEDDGCGMTPDVVNNLFEPFFTTKKSGKGTGLGLSISNRIVSDHGGRIEAKSDGPDQGSTFVVCLPRVVSQQKGAA